jgi:hypothetical protein
MPLPVLTRRRALAGLLAGSLPAHATQLDAPRGNVVLSISGAVLRQNAPGRADFDMAMLTALPQQRLSTRTPWHAGQQQFSGPLLRTVLEQAGATGRLIVAVGLNEYRAEIPQDDTTRYPVILALRHNGQPMRVRDKGPLFIVYPYDLHDELRADRYYARSVWQLRHLVVQ